VTRVTPTLPGYASVARASEVLHLAKRSVRDLIYAGRLPSLRVGRLHFIKAADLERERRRRLGITVRGSSERRSASGPRRSASLAPARSDRAPVRTDPALRRERAAERAELVKQWVRRHAPLEPHVPAVVLAVTTPLSCEVCGREVRRGRIVELTQDGIEATSRLCLACGRRALLEWADRRRQEAAAARRLAESFGQPEPSLSESRVA
jgi:excisionase family DNA binding protein